MSPTPPELATEAGRAGLYALLGGAALKLAETLLRRSDKQRDQNADEIGATIRTGAQLREELRRENEILRQRQLAMEEKVANLEAEVQRLEDEINALKRKLSDAETTLQDAQAELRMLKRAQRTPIPPSRPPDGER